MPIIAELTDGTWVVKIPVHANYTMPEARHILGLGERRIQNLVNEGKLEGPESTKSRPVDHIVLVHYAEKRSWQEMRLRIRREVREAVRAHFSR